MLLILSLQPAATIIQLGNAWGRKLSIFSLKKLTSVHSTREAVWKLLPCFPLTCSGSVSYTILSVKQERILEELDDEAKIHIIRGPRTGANSWPTWAWTVLDLLFSQHMVVGALCVTSIDCMVTCLTEHRVMSHVCWASIPPATLSWRTFFTCSLFLFCFRNLLLKLFISEVFSMLM